MPAGCIGWGALNAIMTAAAPGGDEYWAESRGHCAGLDGLPLSECPYTAPNLAAAWRKGHAVGAEQYRKSEQGRALGRALSRT